jgi:mannose-6-phosphate isomerase-like protein (cupin superfamily)
MLIEALNDEIISYTRYENNQIIFIDNDGKDHKVKNKLTYGDWIKKYKNVTNIKVEGLEDNNYHLQLLKDYDLNFKMKNVHLFYNQLGGFSFPEHIDDIDVLLCVIKGGKKVFIENYPIVVNEGQSISIPKGAKHKVESLPFTWALSIGYK